MKVCPECLSNNFNHDKIHDEISCRHCGLVLIAPYEHGIVHQGFKIVSHRKRTYILSGYGKCYCIQYKL